MECYLTENVKFYFFFSYFFKGVNLHVQISGRATDTYIGLSIHLRPFFMSASSNGSRTLCLTEPSLKTEINLCPKNPCLPIQD